MPDPVPASAFRNSPPLSSERAEALIDLRERLKLFIPFCRAVQHVHQKAILHRDLKPSNLLAAKREAIARATGEALKHRRHRGGGVSRRTAV